MNCVVWYNKSIDNNAFVTDGTDNAAAVSGGAPHGNRSAYLSFRLGRFYISG